MSKTVFSVIIPKLKEIETSLLYSNGNKMYLDTCPASFIQFDSVRKILVFLIGLKSKKAKNFGLEVRHQFWP